MSGNHPPVILINMAVNILNGKECDTLKSQYAQRVSEVGAVPMLIPSIEKPEIIDTLLDLADGVLFIGGKDYLPSSYGCEPHPATFLGRLRPHFDIAFAQAVLRRNMPVLGICGGCQLLNIVTGGKLIQHLDNAEDHRNGKIHTARITRNGFFAEAVQLAVNNELTVNSYHHQAVDPDNLGKNIKVTALAFDGSIEAIELDTPDRMILGVQFHPERLDDISPKIFGYFCKQASLYKQKSSCQSRNHA